jgi:hypothetical protein
MLNSSSGEKSELKGRRLWIRNTSINLTYLLFVVREAINAFHSIKVDPTSVSLRPDTFAKGHFGSSTMDAC